ncbi:MAG: hypothetical protein A2504_09585 [Bdellovibrionales bacterium RIFOXYD12_FULL_39_22]|nr:MAG: hypothetical protein A2385_13075 [Bdellovibrionales bacterium RIFOXYB1_FULL_39_21]OFZ40978.1 MAG: hypothetical protein A2485_16585 [Bdellovibrionales bacterium RIFOXYC12_FULL_39_17]OFZ44806.1 MAG: hypothetical protein A2404_09875 [Bdellovibrionales bacterium RIFOXYC1_FULL_39_130]OFZ69347.1 MAG: hypothetical protein A2451_01005 [Bdellovibrionales bacterium RIFOXYC2_FULL_39_8]OFZ74271.1 MAG: hypothetical protein A2560_16840 [Bdellovibrionales bacterium RIFOXYD1_FULL_39_84]OFZ92135.1 MAG:
MKKQKITKANLLSYLDGELNDRDSKIVKNHLLENEEDTNLLQKIVTTDREIAIITDITISSNLRKTILNNAHQLLQQKKMHKAKSRNFSKSFTSSTKLLTSSLKKLTIYIPAEYLALGSLLVIFVSLLQTPSSHGNFIAFNTNPQVVSAESDIEYNVTEYDNNDLNKGEQYDK